MSTLVGLLPKDEHLDHAMMTLRFDGVPADHVEVLTEPGDVWQRLGGRQRLQKVFGKALWGMLVGLGIGMLYGVPAGYFNCQLMNCSLSTAIVQMVLIALYWMAGGAIIGAIIGLDRLERSLYTYVEGVRRGEALLVVDTTAYEAEEVAEIINRDAASAVHLVE